MEHAKGVIQMRQAEWISGYGQAGAFLAGLLGPRHTLHASLIKADDYDKVCRQAVRALNQGADGYAYVLDPDEGLFRINEG